MSVENKNIIFAKIFLELDQVFHIMTLHDKTFSLFDFKRKADKIQIFDESMIDDDGNIIPFVDQAALVTHYLQLKDSGVSIPYAQKAQDILENLQLE